jgi:hypothetical protein
MLASKSKLCSPIPFIKTTGFLMGRKSRVGKSIDAYGIQAPDQDCSVWS